MMKNHANPEWGGILEVGVGVGILVWNSGGKKT
jgi:hypothetical protein